METNTAQANVVVEMLNCGKWSIGYGRARRMSTHMITGDAPASALYVRAVARDDGGGRTSIGLGRVFASGAGWVAVRGPRRTWFAKRGEAGQYLFNIAAGRVL